MKLLKLIPGLVLALVLITAVSVSVPQPAQAVTPTVQRCSVADAGASLTTLTQRTFTATCPGVALGDGCEVGASADLLLLTVSCYVSAANTVKVIVMNGTAGTVVAPNTTYRIQLFQWYVSP